MPKEKFIELSKSFFVSPAYADDMKKLDLMGIKAVFNFNQGKNLTKSNLAGFRTRLQFEMGMPGKTMFLKRYDKPPIILQLKNWFSHRKRISCGFCDISPAEELNKAGINTADVIAYGQEWSGFFEKRSFCITEKIPHAESLERKLPDFFYASPAVNNLKLRRNFLGQLAKFVKMLHDTGLRHRDLYLCHIFYNSENFYLIDLARVFKPIVFSKRYRIKDIAQLHYSSPAKYFSKTDRLRFYLQYAGKNKLSSNDKVFILKVENKALKIARHDIKHGRTAPFTDKAYKIIISQ